MTRRPPRLTERLLAASIGNKEWRNSIIGDLREEFHDVRQTLGEAAARRWYWRQALAIGSRTVTSRLRLSRQQRAWIAPPDTTNAGWKERLMREFTHACRTLVRRSATSGVIVVTLALALSANSTSFAVMDAVVLRPFRFPNVDRVVVVASSRPDDALFDRESVKPADFREWQREVTTIRQLAAAEWWDANLSGIDQPEQVPAHKVTADFFDAFGARPVLGRDFVPNEEEPGQHRRVVLGHTLWTRLFAADPAIVGRTVRVDGEPFEVVGVAPPWFAIPDGAQLWAPLAYTSDQWANRRNGYLVTVGRLRDDATLADARAELATIAERQRRAYPETHANVGNQVRTFTDGMQDPGSTAFVSLILAASVLLLLIACANIANLLLAGGSERTQEFAVRAAIGGSRLRLAWQLMLEAGLLTAIAVVLALPLAAAGLAITRASFPASIVRFMPGWAYLELSPTVFLVTAAFGALATVLFAVIPSFQTVRGDVANTLRQGARTVTASPRRYWLRNTLAGAQVALTLALLYGSGLLLSGVDRAVNGVLGFDKRGLLVARVVLPDRPYADVERRRQFITGVLDHLRTIPAVSQATIVNALPYAGGNASRQFWPEGVTLRDGEARTIDYRRITPEYFDVMRIPILAGRGLDAGDRVGGQNVAMVSKSLVDRYWPNTDAIGRRFKVAADGELITIVGIVGDILQDWFQQRRAPTVYRPVEQDMPFGHAYVVRTVGDPLSVAGDVRRAVAAMDADQPVMSMQSMEGLMKDRTAGLTYISGMVTVVAGIAFVLALIGLYSLMAYIVSQRTQELGVRLALGATRWQIVALTTRQGVYITTAGVLAGAAMAAALGRVMESALFGLIAMSAWHLVVFAGVVATVSAIASYLPSRMASRLDPMAALRTD